MNVMLSQVFFVPTVKQFVYITISYLVIACVLGFYFSAFTLVFPLAILALITIIQVSKYLKPPIYPKTIASFWMFPLGLIFIVVIYFNVLSQSELVYSSNQLSTVEAIIPSKAYYYRGTGKGSRSHSYLQLNNTNFHCAEDEMNDCKNVYSYAGKLAKIWYQPHGFDGNLIYQIEIDGQKIYSFDEQLKNFTTQRERKNRELIWAFILFVLPMGWFIWQNKKIVATLPKMNGAEIEAIQNKAMKIPTRMSGKAILKALIVISLMSIAVGAFFHLNGLIIFSLLILGLFGGLALFIYVLKLFIK